MSLRILKSVFSRPLLNGAQNVLRSQKDMSRNLWKISPAGTQNSQKFLQHNLNCKCGCNSRLVHTKGPLRSKAAHSKAPQITPGEKELADFLDEEIAAERKLQKAQSLPSEIEGFKVKTDGAEVTLIKQTGDETIEVNFNINHSVDMDVEPDVNPSLDKPEMGEMKSRPNFEVEIKRDGKTLGFTCSIVTPSATANQHEETGYNDLFAIDEVVMYEGEWKESNYAVSGEVIDGTLYDLLMNMLEDKGISNEFVEKITELSTGYEHKSYIDMLEKVKKFVSLK